MGKLKLATIPATLGQLGDRFLCDGYKERSPNLEQILAQVKELGTVEALELMYSGSGKESDADYINEQLKKYGFKASFAMPTLHCEKRWKYGTLSARDLETRKSAIEFTKKTMDFAKKIGAMGVGLWLGQDGYDYSFTTDYKSQWGNLIESLKEIADYMPEMKVSLEPKLREPRCRALIDSTNTALLACLEADRKNVGVTIDVGHVFQAGSNVSQNIEMANKYGKMFNFHVNDNYGTWDDDMIFGSVRFLECLEMFYTLNKIGYNSYMSVDIFPFRENSINATRESLLFMHKYNDIVDKLGMEKLAKLIDGGDITEVLSVIRNEVF